MSCGSGPKIVNDGLVLCLDAANKKSILTEVEVLIVAGGGAGGSDFSSNGAAGGGGGGGVITATLSSLSPNTPINVTVGAGGVSTDSSVQRGGNGGNSQISVSSGLTLTAIGGGGGDGSQGTLNGAAGGSGGGGGQPGAGATSTTNNGGAGTPGQGYAGGNGANGGLTGDGRVRAGGGGGAGGPGYSARALNGSQGGGPGIPSSISGTLTYYGGGGGAGDDIGNGYTLGGIGGGANGSNTTGKAPSGTPNTGGGGGGNGADGGSSRGGDGGSGIVIIRYPGPQKAVGGTVSSANGYTIHTFTATGAATFTPTIWADVSSIGGPAASFNNPMFVSSNPQHFTFDTTTDYYRLSRTDLNGGTFAYPNITIDLWIKPSLTGDGGVTGNNVITVENTFEISIGNNGNGYSGVNYASNPWAWYGNSGDVLTNGVWNNLVFVHATTGRWLYVNGVEVFYRGDTGNLNVGSATYPYLTLMGRTDGTGASAEGGLSAVKIYNRALSADEIQQNFNALKGRHGL